MLSKKTIITIILTLVITISLILGCSGPASQIVDSQPIFSEADSQILWSAYTDYFSLEQSSSPDIARQKLVKKLNDEEGVVHAYLGADGTSIGFSAKAMLRYHKSELTQQPPRTLRLSHLHC